MKRIFTVLLSLVMIFCASAAFAESDSPYGRVSMMSGQVMPFESVTGLFAMDIPSDYIVMDSEIFQTITEAMLSMDADTFYSNFGFELEAAKSLLGSMSADSFAGYDFIYAPDFIGNINATATPGAGLTPEFLELYGDMLGQELTAQYVSMGVPEDNCNYLGVLTYGNNIFLGFSVQLLDEAPTYQYMVGNANGDLICLTFTSIEEDAIVPILESMIVY